MIHRMCDLDTDWIIYLRDTARGRRQQCEDIFAGRAITAVIMIFAVAIGVIYGLHKGWF